MDSLPSELLVMIHKKINLIREKRRFGTASKTIHNVVWPITQKTIEACHNRIKKDFPKLTQLEIDTLELCHDGFPLPEKYFISQNFVLKNSLLMSSRINDLEFALHKGVISLTVNDSHIAASNGSLMLLAWLKIQGFFDASLVSEIAALKSHLSVLKWLAQMQIEPTENTINNISIRGNIEVLQWIRTEPYIHNPNICANLASNGHFNALQWVRDPAHGPIFDWDIHTCAGAAYAGRQDIIDWLLANGAPINIATLYHAVLRDHYDLMKHLRIKYDAPWNETVTAAATNSLRCLKWLRKHGCPWSDSTPAHAIANASMECLEWAHQNNCPWNPIDLCHIASACGNLEALQYILQHGGEITEGVCALAQENDRANIIDWLKKEGLFIEDLQFDATEEESSSAE